MNKKLIIAYSIVGILMVASVILGAKVFNNKTENITNALSDISNTVTYNDFPKPDKSEKVTLSGNKKKPNETFKSNATNKAVLTKKPVDENISNKTQTKIIFTGDVYLPNYLQKAYTAKGINGIMTKDLQSKLIDADVLMINNEFPFSNRGTKQDKKFTFRLNPSFVSVLTDIGVDIASLANNHCQDYGKISLSDTFTTLENAGIKYAGAGESVERAKEIQIMTVNGRKYGFIAASRVVPYIDWRVEKSTPGVFSCYDDKELIELVKRAKMECDYVAVFPHWGVERKSYPEKYQSQIAKDCIEAGADTVVGAHSHCLQGIEYIDGKPVFYSLGNFIFSYDIDMSAVLEVSIESSGNVIYKIVPVYTKNGITAIARDKKANEIINHLNKISDNASLDYNGFVSSISKQ